MKSGTMIFDELKPYENNARALNRLNHRYRHIIEPNAQHIAGKRILDLGSHDGRWQWAALKSGAAHVTGIEGRKELVESSKDILAEFPPSRHETIQGDMFEVLGDLAKNDRAGTFDTVLCLGVFYHILEHLRFLELIAALQPAAIIIDSGLVQSDRLYIEAHKEPTGSRLNAVPGGANLSERLVGTVSTGLMAALAEQLGFSLAYVPWRRADVDDVQNLKDYFVQGEGRRRRYTLVLTPRN